MSENKFPSTAEINAFLEKAKAERAKTATAKNGTYTLAKQFPAAYETAIRAACAELGKTPTEFLDFTIWNLLANSKYSAELAKAETLATEKAAAEKAQAEEELKRAAAVAAAALSGESVSGFGLAASGKRK